MLKRVWSVMWASWYYWKLRWQFKGNKQHFKNFMEFQDTPYQTKMTFPLDKNEKWDDDVLKKHLARLRSENPIFRQQAVVAAKLQIEEYNKTPAWVSLRPNQKKTVRQTILEAIEQSKGTV